MSVFRRCGCRSEDGRQYGTLGEKPTAAQTAKACPTMLTDPKHGTWTFRISAGTDPLTGKRRQINGSEYGGPWSTKREAQTAARKAGVDVDDGKVQTNTRMTFAEYLPDWLERRKVMNTKAKKPLAESTIDNYTRYVNRDMIPSALGSMKLRDIRRRHVQDFVDGLAKKRGAVTTARIVAVVQGAFGQAVIDDLIADTPAHHLSLPAIDQKEMEVWEPAQVGHFLDTAAQHRLGALFELAILTGLRRAELCALLWSDVDLAGRELRVRKSKTDAGVRRVALDDRSVGALIAWQIAQGAEREAWGASWARTGHVFTYEDGRPLKLQYATRLFDKIRVKAGLPKMTFHGQRHQQASLQLAAGTDIAVVSKRLGHSSVSVTADIYAHLLRSKDQEAANNASALVPSRALPRRDSEAPEEVGAHALHTHGPENAEEAASAFRGNGL